MTSFCILSISDSLSTCDTLIVKFTEQNYSTLHLLQNTAPNTESVQIAETISWAIVAAIATCFIGFIILKALSLFSGRKKSIQKRREDLEDIIIKYKAEELSRSISATNDNKQRKVSHFIDQYIESLKKNESSVDYQKEKDVLMSLLKENASLKDTSDTSNVDYQPLYHKLDEIIKGYGKE